MDNAFATAHDLATFLGRLSNVTVAGHSLGNMLVGSAIHDWGARPANYFMINAAVAKESYDESEEQLTSGGTMGMEHPEWMPYDRRLWCSDWHIPFDASDHRSTLTWENRLETVGVVAAYNFYSSGEEVLKNPSSAPHLPLSANEVWNNQERMKGRMLTGQVLSSNYGGWQFNPHWDVLDLGNPPNYSRHLPLSQTTTITDGQLKTDPFFKPGPMDLYGANGSNYASPQQHRNTLLAEMIPALSFAAGANPLGTLAPPGDSNKNFDMMAYKTDNLWPRSNPEWEHSDIKIVAYSYVYQLYNKFVELGELKG